MQLPLDVKKIREWADRCRTKTEAAERLGLTSANIHKLLRADMINPRLSSLERFADAMGLEPAELIRRDEVIT